MSGFVTLALIFWMLVSTINQFAPKLIEKLQRWDLFALVPNWRFFSPIPKKADTLIAARAWTGDAQPADWTVVSPPLTFAPWCVLFHPRSRLQKATGDLSMFLLAHVGSLSGDVTRARSVLASLPYTILLSYALTQLCDAAPQAGKVSRIQFAVIDAFGDLQTPRVLFMSEIHDAGIAVHS